MAPRDPETSALTMTRGAPLGDLAGQLLVGENEELIARLRRLQQPQDLDRHARLRAADAAATVVEHRFHPAPGGPRHNHVARVEGAALHQQRGDGAAGAVDLGFDHDTGGRLVRVGLQLVHVGDETDDLQQIIQPHLLQGRDLDEGDVAAPLLGHDLDLGELLLDPIRVSRRQVDLVDGHHHRHLGRFDVRHRLASRRHHAVVGGHDQDRHVGGLGATGAHGGEGLVAGGVEEGDLAPLRIDLIGADVLGDAAGLPCRHIGGADRVEQFGLAVVNVAHDGDHRRPCAGLGVGFGLRTPGFEVLPFAGQVGLFRVRLPAEGLGHAS
ncbi:MAG: hypothetical protein K0S78_4580, partial [Thermomicrobiales bacterium]|nr:hypothetical protein [Thermomicrobiales bacterium]